MQTAALSLTRDEAEAEDLTQSLFGDLYGVRLEADRRVSKLAHYAGRGSLGGWLRAVVYQAFIDRKRQTARLEENVLVTAKGPVVFTLMEHMEEAMKR